MGKKMSQKGGKPASAAKQKKLDEAVGKCPLGEHREGNKCVPNKSEKK